MLKNISFAAQTGSRASRYILSVIICSRSLCTQRAFDSVRVWGSLPEGSCSRFRWDGATSGDRDAIDRVACATLNKRPIRRCVHSASAVLFFNTWQTIHGAFVFCILWSLSTGRVKGAEKQAFDRVCESQRIGLTGIQESTPECPRLATIT